MSYRRITNSDWYQTIANIQANGIGGVNLIPNGNFDIKGNWERWGNGTSSSNTVENNVATVKILNRYYPEPFHCKNGIRQASVVDFIEGEDYVLSFEARSDFEGLSMNYCFVDYVDGTSRMISDPLAPNMTSEWARVSYHFKPTKTERGGIFIAMLHKEVEGEYITFQVRKVKLEKGIIPTDWSPAPADLVTKVELPTLIDEHLNTSDDMQQIGNQLKMGGGD